MRGSSRSGGSLRSLGCLFCCFLFSFGCLFINSSYCACGGGGAGLAPAKADETARGADQYAADVLVRLESDLVKSLSIIKRSLEVIEERKPQPTEG